MEKRENTSIYSRPNTSLPAELFPLPEWTQRRREESRLLSEGIQRGESREPRLAVYLLKPFFEKPEGTEVQTEGDFGVDPALFCPTRGFALGLI